MSKRYNHGVQSQGLKTLKEITKYNNKNNYESLLFSQSNISNNIDLVYQKVCGSLDTCVSWIDVDPNNEYLRKTYFPEFMNCLDEWLIFNPSEEEINKIKNELLETLKKWLNICFCSLQDLQYKKTNKYIIEIKEIFELIEKIVCKIYTTMDKS